ncbi:2'-5' RNA ligase family protein [Nocardioides limicola]|uniref:2'-5' RNA ligase family protein n=1 Tax=Nocardioides limicola TaxID=2803368 RepID=UPI00193C2A5D|nr:2'-5' RNA ligase family protein [Nocardioides sp. DJM-14]
MTTIGVAVAIPEPWASQLQEYRVSIGDDTATRIPTHITLVPPLEVSTADLEVIEGHLMSAAARVPSFVVHLRGTGTFRPVSDVVYVMLAEGVAGCERLAAEVRKGPLATELEFPYHPHVTIAHDLDEAALDRAFKDLAGFECRFEAVDFHLYTHDEAAGWQPRREFALTAPTEAP